MKFDRLDTDELAQTGTTGVQSASAQVFGNDIRGAWISTCHHVIVIIKHWNAAREAVHRCNVEIYAGVKPGVTEHIVSIQCKRDGSAAFVAREVMDSLADYSYAKTADIDDLLERMVNLRAMLTDGGKEEVTLARFHRYREGMTGR